MIKFDSTSYHNFVNICIKDTCDDYGFKCITFNSTAMLLWVPGTIEFYKHSGENKSLIVSVKEEEKESEDSKKYNGMYYTTEQLVNHIFECIKIYREMMQKLKIQLGV